VWNRRLPPPTHVAALFLVAKGALRSTPLHLIAESLVALGGTATRGTMGRGRGVVRLPPVPGMRVGVGCLRWSGMALGGTYRKTSAGV